MEVAMNLRVVLLAMSLAGVFAEPVALGADTETPTKEAKAVKPLAKCAAVTGSHIRPKVENGCEARKPNRSYTLEDIQRTGEIDLNQALRRLDPMFY
jgi:hypothetical protein